LRRFSSPTREQVARVLCVALRILKSLFLSVTYALAIIGAMSLGYAKTQGVTWNEIVSALVVFGLMAWAVKLTFTRRPW
jgi:hypothetical protein